LPRRCDNSPANLGSITQAGSYVAPGSGSGEVLVVATSTEDSDIRGTALVEVGSCECFWSLSIAGEGAWSGPLVLHNFPTAANPIFILQFSVLPENGTGGGGVSIREEFAPSPGETGTFPIDTFAFQAGSLTWAMGPDADGTSATLFVDENITDKAMTGSAVGTVLTVIDNEEFLRNFDLNFRSSEIGGSCE